MAEDLKSIPSWNEFVHQKTGRTLTPLENIPTTEQRIPSFEEFLVSRGAGPSPWVTQLPQPEAEQPGEFMKGLYRGGLETQALLHGGVGAVADMVGADDFARRRIEDYTRLMEEAEQYSAEVGSIEEIDSPGKFFSWAAGTLGEQVPNIVSVALSGGMGALVGKLAAKQAVKGVSKEIIEQQLKNKIAAWTAKGALGGTYLGASALEAGGIFGEQVEAGVEPQGGVAVLGGGAAGMLEVIPFVTVARRLGFGNQAKSKILQKIAEMSMPKRILTTGALVGGQESGTESLQEVIALAAREFVDENYDALGPEGVSRVLNSAAAGALLGFTFGAPSGIRQGGISVNEDEFAPNVEAITPEKKAPAESIQTPTGVIPDYVESPKTPYQELYVLDNTGLKRHQDVLPSEIIVNSAGLTDSNIKSVLEGLVERINQEEERNKSIQLPDTKAQEGEERGIYLGPEIAAHKTLARLVRAYNDTLGAYTIHRDRGALKRLRALDAAIQATSRREAIELPPYLKPADIAAKAATQLEGNTPSPTQDKVDIPAESVPKEIIITDKAPGGYDLSTLNPGQRQRAMGLLEKDQLEGLSPREYQVLERLLARAQGEKAAERMPSNLQQEAAETEQLINQVQQDETTKSELKDEGVLGISREEVFNAVKGMLEGLKLVNLPKVKIVHSLDLYNTPLAEKAARSRGLYQLTRDGESIVYLIEDNIPSAQAAVRTLMHELVAHHGLRAFLTPEQLNSFRRLVEKNVNLEPLKTRYEVNRGNLTDEQFNLMVAEEYVAKIAEDGTHMSLLNRIIAWIKTNLRKWFPKWSKDNISLTDEDIRYMLRNVHQFLRGRLDAQNQGGAAVHVGRSGQLYTSKTAAQADSIVGQINEDKNNPRRNMFWHIGDYQRGLPERAMLTVQHLMGGGVLNPVVEHAGDLTHRMTELGSFNAFGYEYVKDKVEKVLAYLTYPYGFARELQENITSNAQFSGLDPIQLEMNINAALKKYADEHSKVPVINDAHRVARQVAISLGERKWDRAIANLRILSKHLKTREDWKKYAGQGYTDATVSTETYSALVDPNYEIAHAVNNLGNLWGVKFSKLFLTPLQIAEKYKIEPVKKYVEAVQRFWAGKAEIIADADGTVTEWRKLGKNSAQRVAKALFEISEESDIKEERLSDGFVNDWLRNKFKLSDEEMGLYWKIDTSLRDLLNRLENGVKYNAARDSLNTDPSAFLKEWDSAFTFADRQAVVEKYSTGGLMDLTLLQRMNEIQEQFDLMRNRNYFPRMRFGRYTVAVRASESGVVNGEDVDTDSLVHFEAFESAKAAKVGLAEIEKEFAGQNVYIQESKLSDTAFTFMGLPPALRSTLTKELNLDPQQEELLKDVFIKMSPGRSFMKHLRKRRGTAGYSEDAMRVFAGYMMSAANHLARVEHFADMQAPIAQMREWEGSARRFIPNNRSLVELREYFEEHLNYLLNPENDWAKLRAMGFLWYLGLNPKSAMVNATQVPMVTYPYLASKYGDGRTVSSIMDAYKRVSKTLRGRGPGVLSQEEMALFERLTNEGILDESQVMELAGIAEAPSLFRILPEQTDTKIINNLSYVGGWMFRYVEKFNRRVAALSAYTLAKESGMNVEDAYQAAKTAVQTTQYEYAKWNRPKFMRGRKSVIFLFWQYLQHTSYLMAGGAGKQTAMRMWLMMLTMSGMLGLPFAEDMLDLIDWGGTQVKELTGMKDPKVDTREAIRDLLVQLTDNPDFFLHGLGRYYGLGPIHLLEALGIPVPNLDISGSLSLGRIVPGVEQATMQSNNPNDKFGRVMMDILGPVAAMGFNMWKALESSDPDVWKKWERAMPIAMKNASRGARWMARGEETSKTGAQILEFDPYDYQEQAEKVAQLFGFTPTRLGQKYELMLAQREAQRYWMMRRTVLLQHFGYAKLMHDQEGISDTRAAIRDFNRTVPDNALRITGKDISNSLRQRTRIKRLSELGQPTQRRYRQLFESKSDLYPEAEE